MGAIHWSFDQEPCFLCQRWRLLSSGGPYPAQPYRQLFMTARRLLDRRGAVAANVLGELHPFPVQVKLAEQPLGDIDLPGALELLHGGFVPPGHELGRETR